MQLGSMMELFGSSTATKVAKALCDATLNETFNSINEEASATLVPFSAFSSSSAPSSSRSVAKGWHGVAWGGNATPGTKEY